jgi:hypothetical protein
VADKGSVRVPGWSSRYCVAACAALATIFWSSATASAVTAGPSCGEKTIASPDGVSIRILFAQNGAVQRYEVIAKVENENTELINDATTSLEGTYGPAGVNAPPLKILSFKPGDSSSGGMMVPDKAIDSCGRTLSFN